MIEKFEDIDKHVFIVLSASGVVSTRQVPVIPLPVVKDEPAVATLLFFKSLKYILPKSSSETKTETYPDPPSSDKV